jgi:inorganic triphosphatase YgiF
LAVEGSERDGSHGIAERLAHEDAAVCVGEERGRSAGGERLGPVAVVKTPRTAYRVLNADGELVVEIADDQVASGPPGGESRLHSWREVEVELEPAGKTKDLKLARWLLRAAGATPSTIRTKLDRALGATSSDGTEPAAKAGTCRGTGGRSRCGAVRCAC